MSFNYLEHFKICDIGARLIAHNDGLLTDFNKL